MELQADERAFFQRAKVESTEKIEALERLAADSVAQASLLKCRFCKQATVSHYQSQIRSADEGMSTICVCRSCHRRFIL